MFGAYVSQRTGMSYRVERTTLVYGPQVLTMFIRTGAADVVEEVIVVKFVEQTAQPMPYLVLHPMSDPLHEVD